MTNVDRQLTVAASSVLLGFSSGPVAADGCLGCLAPYRRHSYLSPGVPSRLVTSQHHSAALATPMTLQAHRSTGVDVSYLSDFGK